MSKSEPENSSEPKHTPDPQSIEGLFLSALAKEVGDERDAFLDETCGDDDERRMRIVALLRAYDDAGSFLERPISGLSATQSLDLSFLEKAEDPSLLGMLGPYEVYELIGRGGMGMVFRARDPKLNRVVAIKVLAPELAAHTNARLRFLREAQAAAAISHPHVVTIHAVEDRAEDDKKALPFLVMECIVGQTLQQKLDKQGSLRLTEIVRISQQMADGLAAAHKQGLVHRDIKPANILLENGVERVKISDFGLARAVDDATITRTGEVSGTPQYMSPEQASGERIDHRSDLFSLGCVMYAMCTGRSPFRSTSLVAAIKRVCHDTPRPIEEINPELPAWLIQFINQLLNKEPDQRPQSSAEVAKFLEQHLANLQQPGNPVTSIAAVATNPPQPAASPVRTAASSPATAIPLLRRPIFWAVLLLAVSPFILPLILRPLAAVGLVSVDFASSVEAFLVSTLTFVPLGFLLIAGSVIMHHLRRRSANQFPAQPPPLASPAMTATIAEEPSSTSPKYIPTPIGFLSSTFSVLAAAIATAIFLSVTRSPLGREWLNFIVYMAPKALGLLLLAVLAARRIAYPHESIRSIGAWGAAFASLSITAYLPFLAAEFWPLHYGTLVGGVTIGILLVGATVFAIRKSLNERSDADYLLAESCESAGNHYLVVGIGVLALGGGCIVALLQNSQRLGRLADYAPQIVAAAFAIGCVFLVIGVSLRRRATENVGAGPSAIGSYLLLGPLGIVLWMSHRDRQVRNELRQLRSGTTEPEPQPVVLERESSTATMGRYLTWFGCFLAALPVLHLLALKLLGWIMPTDNFNTNGLLALLVGVIAVALGLGLRKFSDDQKPKQRPLRLLRVPLTVLLLVATAGSAICIEHHRRVRGYGVAESRSVIFFLDPAEDFPEIAYVLINKRPAMTTQRGRQIEINLPSSHRWAELDLLVVTKDGRAFHETLQPSRSSRISLHSVRLSADNLAKVSVELDSSAYALSVNFQDVNYSTDFTPYACHLPVGTSQRVTVAYRVGGGRPTEATKTIDIESSDPISLTLREILEGSKMSGAGGGSAMMGMGEYSAGVGGPLGGSSMGEGSIEADLVTPTQDSSRQGTLKIDMKNDGLRVGLRRLSSFDSRPVPGSEQQVTKFGLTELALAPGDYEVIVHDRWFGWAEDADKISRITVKADGDMAMPVERQVAKLKPQIGVGDFYWNRKKAFSAFDTGQAGVMDALVRQFGEMKQSLSLEELKQVHKNADWSAYASPVEPATFDDFWENNRPTCLVSGATIDSWQLAPVPRGVLRIVVTAAGFRGDIVPIAPDSPTSTRRFVEWQKNQREFEFKLPPGKYTIQPEHVRVGWARYSASTLSPELFKPDAIEVEVTESKSQTVEVGYDFEQLVQFSREDFNIKDDGLVFRWNVHSQTGSSGGGMNRQIHFHLDRTQEAIVKVLLQGLAVGQSEIAEAEILEKAGIVDQAMSDVFENPDPTNAGAFMRGHEKLILPGEAEGTWRLAPLPR